MDRRCPICTAQSSFLSNKHNYYACRTCGTAIRPEVWEELTRIRAVAQAIAHVDAAYQGRGSILLDRGEVATRFGKIMTEDGPLGEALIELFD